MHILTKQFLKKTLQIGILTSVMFAYQNCGGGFETSHNLASLASSQGQGNPSVPDTTPPALTILSPAANTYINSSVTVAGSCEPGIPVIVVINSGSPQNVNCNGGSFSSIINVAAGDGSHQLNISQTDPSGNSTLRQIPFMKDTVSPAVSFTSPMANAQVTSQALMVSGACESGLLLTIAGNALSAPVQVNCVSNAFQSNVSLIATSGTANITLSQTDAAGNTGNSSRAITIALPSGAPVIRISAPAANSLTRTGITLTGTCVSGLPIQISGSGVSANSQTTCTSGAFSSSIQFSNGDGVKNVIVSQTNAQSQTGQDSRSFTLDATAPNVMILSPAANSQSETSINLGGQCESGLTVSIGGAGVAGNSTTTCNSAMFQANIALSTGAGPKVITVSQTDAAGNTGSNSRTFERIAPILNGQVLYANNCATCHGALASSTKLNRSAASITSAISAIPSMTYLSTLSSAQISAIAGALVTSTPPVQACTDTSRVLAAQVKRLTMTQFANSLKNAFGNIFQDSQFPALGDSNPRIGLASDADHLTVNEVNIHPLYASVEILVPVIRTQNSTVSACVATTGTTCFDTIATDMGRRLWRRPLTSTETAALTAGMNAVTSASGTRAQRMDFLLKALIMSPDHIYRTEIGASTTPATQIFTLTQYEVASLLAFTAWDSPPDDTLLEAARTNALTTKAQLKTQLTRLMQDARFTRKMANFAVDILKIEDIKTVAKDASFGMTAADRTALYSSARMTLEEGYATPSADFMSPFTTRKFYNNNLTSRYFGATSSSSTLTAFTADANQRLGMLSHPAFLTSMSGEISSGIVRRGVYTLEQLLCNHLGAPPDNVAGVKTLPPGWDPAVVTSREVLQVTHSNQPACIGCHSKIDPAGFGFENYSPFGQFRLVEKGSVQIDASGSLADVAAQPLNFSNSVGYLTALSQSSTLRQCMNKRFFKQTFGESHETSQGQCEFSNVEVGVSQKGNSSQALLESLIELESFSRRRPASQ